MDGTEGVAKATQVVSGTIKELLDHSDGIAAWLANEGWVGQPQDGGACPITKLLDHRLEEAGVTDAWATTRTDLVEVEGESGWCVTIVLPAKIREFVWDFDNLKYPELIDGVALVPPPTEAPYGIVL